MPRLTKAQIEEKNVALKKDNKKLLNKAADLETRLGYKDRDLKSSEELRGKLEVHLADAQAEVNEYFEKVRQRPWFTAIGFVVGVFTGIAIKAVLG